MSVADYLAEQALLAIRSNSPKVSLEREQVAAKFKPRQELIDSDGLYLTILVLRRS